jgi:hypothetical protein
MRDNPRQLQRGEMLQLEQQPRGTGIADVKLQGKHCVHGFVSEFLVSNHSILA